MSDDPEARRGRHMADVLLVRGLELAEGHGLNVRALAIELRDGETEMTAERIGDQVRLGLRGRTERLLGDVPALLVAWQPGFPSAN